MKPDTHGTKHKGWIGVDLDGTLAHYDGWVGIHHIGNPIPKMLARVKKWLAEGQEVRILTARATPDRKDYGYAVAFIKKWLIEHVGQALTVTNAKDLAMVELWDDRCVQVVPNTGERADGRGE